jgi:hypothetical protein
MEPLSKGHSYQNYANSESKDFGKIYFGGNLKQLVEVKRKCDPGDFVPLSSRAVARITAAPRRYLTFLGD